MSFPIRNSQFKANYKIIKVFVPQGKKATFPYYAVHNIWALFTYEGGEKWPYLKLQVPN